MRILLVSFDTAETILDRIGKAMNSKERGLSLIGALIEREFVPEDISELYTTLKAARDAVVHEKRVTPSKIQVREFIGQSLYMTEALNIAFARVTASQAPA